MEKYGLLTKVIFNQTGKIHENGSTAIYGENIMEKYLPECVLTSVSDLIKKGIRSNKDSYYISSSKIAFSQNKIKSAGGFIWKYKDSQNE